MKELITRIEELAVQVAGAQLQIDKSEAESRELGRELGKARQKMMELVNERDHALARVPPESWAKENKRLAAQREDLLGVIERRELLIKSLNDEITKRDHELRAHEKELAEQREEIRKIRAEVPLESTREALKNTVAKLQEVTTDRDRLQNEIVRLNAKLGPLEALYKTLKGYHDSDKIIGHGSIIKGAIDVATEALSQLTA
jgi:chromosome segregation ATPase